MKRVSVDDLLMQPKDITLDVPGRGEMTLWLRPARDLDRTMAAALARKASRMLRKILEDRESEEYIALIESELEGADEISLRRIWVNGKIIPLALEIRTESLEERDYIPNPLDDEDRTAVTPKEMDKYEDAVDDAEESRELNVMQAIQAAQKRLDEESKNIPTSELFEAAVPQMIESLCQQAHEDEYMAQIVMRGTFTDKKMSHKLFKEVSQVYQTKPGFRAKLVTEHLSMLTATEDEAVKN